MHPITAQAATELDVLYGLYELAIEYTHQIQPDEPALTVKWLDARQALLSKTQVASQEASSLLKKHKSLINIPASERALVEEKRLLIREILGKIKDAENDMLQKMNNKMSNIRGELVGIHQKKQAAKAYISTPGPTYAVR